MKKTDMLLSSNKLGQVITCWSPSCRDLWSLEISEQPGTQRENRGKESVITLTLVDTNHALFDCKSPIVPESHESEDLSLSCRRMPFLSLVSTKASNCIFRLTFHPYTPLVSTPFLHPHCLCFLSVLPFCFTDSRRMRQMTADVLSHLFGREPF